MATTKRRRKHVPAHVAISDIQEILDSRRKDDAAIERLQDLLGELLMTYGLGHAFSSKDQRIVDTARQRVHRSLLSRIKNLMREIETTDGPHIVQKALLSTLLGNLKMATPEGFIWAEEDFATINDAKRITQGVTFLPAASRARGKAAEYERVPEEELAALDYALQRANASATSTGPQAYLGAEMVALMQWNQFKCPICKPQKVFEKRRELIDHFQEHHDARKESTLCVYCGIVYPTLVLNQAGVMIPAEHTCDSRETWNKLYHEHARTSMQAGIDERIWKRRAIEHGKRVEEPPSDVVAAHDPGFYDDFYSNPVLYFV